MLSSNPEQELSQRPAFEAFYTISELAEILRMSFERVRCMIKNEPDVLRIAPESPAKGRTRISYRIPLSVVQRIIRRNQNRDLDRHRAA